MVAGRELVFTVRPIEIPVGLLTLDQPNAGVPRVAGAVYRGLVVIEHTNLHAGWDGRVAVSGAEEIS